MPPENRRPVLVAATALGALVLITSADAQQPRIGDPPETMNMRLVGHSDLQGRSAYMPTIHRQGDRYIAYVGHHGGSKEIPRPVNTVTGQNETNGTSILDVTDPSKPKYLAHIPGQEGLINAGGAQMTRICDGRGLPKGDPNAVYLLRTFGTLAHEIWNVGDPSAPKLVSRIGGKYKDTHKSWWECDTGIAYLVSGVEGWRTPRMTEVYDLSDPARPIKIRDFGLPGQEPGATGAVPTYLHGMISLGPKANRIYFGYGTNKGGVVQIIDREKLLNGPKEPTPENLRYPQVGRLDLAPWSGAHSAIPLMGMQIPEFSKDLDGHTRDMVMIVNESLSYGCTGMRQMVWFADVTIESQPMVVSNWTVREGLGNFCSRLGRFGAHAANETTHPIFHKKLVFISFFSAGVRVVDIRDPYQPKEVAYFVPAITEATDRRCVRVGQDERCGTFIMTNNVEVDDRGYVYAADRFHTGLHILELTGEPRAIAGLPPVK